MNERIRELAIQAGLEWRLSQPHFTNTSNPIDFPVNPNRELEEFAALIVRDVVATVIRTQVTSPDFEWAMLNNYELEVSNDD